MATKLTSQALLPTIEQVLCACGCGQYFMAQRTPRKRLYLNNTHKKRAARSRKALERKNGTVSLTPKGWVFWYSDNDEQRAELWSQMSPDQQVVVEFLCQTCWSPERLAAVWQDMFGAWEKVFDFRR